MGFFEKLRRRSARKTIRKLPKLHRETAKFRDIYPSYTIGTGTYGALTVSDWHEGSTLVIGPYTSIAANVQIFLGGHHRIDWISCYPFPAVLDEAAHIIDYGGTNGDVIIGSDVWLCSNAMILSGVTIGHGAVVAAGAVVTKDIAPYEVVGGNPARHLKWRFPEAVRAQLLDSCWWDWPEDEICKVSPLLCSQDIDAFLSYCQSR